MATSNVTPSAAGTNGAAMAAILGAAFGSLALGAVVLANESGLFAAPALYEPAGGLSGRTTLGVAAWLLAWGILHRRWQGRMIDVRRVFVWTVVCVVLAVVLTFPPVWGLL